MDPPSLVQDALRCDLCETSVPRMHCDTCHVRLCTTCVGEHLLDGSKEHKVVPFEYRRSTINYPKCPKHSKQICELHCKQCDSPICTLCVSSGEHEQHKKEQILQTLASKKEILQKDLQELEGSIFPKYQEAASNIPSQKADQRKHFQALTTALNKRGEVLHQEVDSIIQRMQSKIDDIDSQHMSVLNKIEGEINQALEEISNIILDLRSLLDSNDMSSVFAYISRNEELRILPTRPVPPLPTFTPGKINRDQLYQEFGSLSELAKTTETFDHAISSPNSKLLIDEPQILADVKLEIGRWLSYLRGVACLNENEFWITTDNKNIRLFNLQGELLNTVETKSGYDPFDIAVTQNRDLVYADDYDRSINIVKDSQVETLIKLHGSTPRGVCISASGELLVIIVNYSKKETKLVRYSGSTETQSIQWDDEGMPLFSYGEGFFKLKNTKLLCENRNLDICVADSHARAVVVVSSVGRFRFRYTGSSSNTKKQLRPRGITTDSQGNILTVDYENQCLHILDQDGHFLRIIDDLHCAWGLSVDSSDNIFVTDEMDHKVKKIKYFK